MSAAEGFRDLARDSELVRSNPESNSPFASVTGRPRGETFSCSRSTRRDLRGDLTGDVAGLISLGLEFSAGDGASFGGRCPKGARDSRGDAGFAGGGGTGAAPMGVALGNDTGAGGCFFLPPKKPISAVEGGWKGGRDEVRARATVNEAFLLELLLLFVPLVPAPGQFRPDAGQLLRENGLTTRFHPFETKGSSVGSTLGTSDSRSARATVAGPHSHNAAARSRAPPEGEMDDESYKRRRVDPSAPDAPGVDVLGRRGVRTSV